MQLLMIQPPFIVFHLGIHSFALLLVMDQVVLVPKDLLTLLHVVVKMLLLSVLTLDIVLVLGGQKLVLSFQQETVQDGIPQVVMLLKVTVLVYQLHQQVHTVLLHGGQCFAVLPVHTHVLVLIDMLI